MRFPIIVLTAVTAAALTIGDRAEAGTVTLTYQTPGSAYGTEGWYTDIRQRVEDRGAPMGRTYRGRAGAFRFTDGISAIMAFCIDPYRYLDIGEVFTVTENASVLENVDKLFTSSFADVTNAITASAFQVALWEVVAETAATYDVTSGNHSVANAAVGAQAQTFLDRISSASTGGYTYTLYSNNGQDQISATPVPLPASALLLLGGIAGLGLMRRKRA